MSRPPRVLLVQMPFFRLDAPSLGLALLEASLDRAGVPCETEHLNLDFGKRIGRELYSWVASRAPRHLLLGDLLFAPILNGQDLDPDRVRALAARLASRRDEPVPPRVLDQVPALAREATVFLEETVARLPWQDYDLVGIGTFFNVVPALALARNVRLASPSSRIILGGCNCEGEMGEQLHRSFPFLDFVCSGEGETLVVQLANALRQERADVEGIEGLVWREETGASRCNPRGAAVSPDPYPLDRFPQPRFDSWIRQAHRAGVLPREEFQLPIETARGCWYGQKRHCLFCGLNGERIQFRRKSPSRVLDDFSSVMSRGIPIIHCVDNSLDPVLLQTVLPQLETINPGCQIFWEVRPGLSRSQMEQLARSGVVWVQAGLESLSTPVLERMGKGTTALQNVLFLRHAAELGIGASWSVLFGFVGEDPADYRAMADLMPDLAHLQPPRMFQQIRVDRFSPLFLEREGLTRVVPSPAYAEVFRLDPDAVARLAYFFEYEYDVPRDPHVDFAACEDAIHRWREEVGRAALIRLDAGDALHIVDTRGVAVNGTTSLRGLERTVYLAAERGASVGEISEATQAEPDAVAEVVRRLFDLRHAVLLDGKVLPLAVPVDAWRPRGVPAVLIAERLRAAYCQRMQRLYRGYEPPPGETAPARCSTSGSGPASP